MEMHLKYDINFACKVLLQEQLEKLEIPYNITEKGTVEFTETVPVEKSKKLEAALKKYGIELIYNSKNILVQQMKEAVQDIIYRNNKPSGIKLSDYMAGKLHLSYSYLSKIFSDETGTSIENYMICHRIERVKQLLLENHLTISEIAWKLNFSSVAHLSNQFKKITGISPTIYQQLVTQNRRNKYHPVNGSEYLNPLKIKFYKDALL